MKKCYDDAQTQLLCHYSFESDFYQLLNNVLPTDRSPFKPLAIPVTTIDTGASTEMCARKQTFVPGSLFKLTKPIRLYMGRGSIEIGECGFLQRPFKSRNNPGNILS